MGISLSTVEALRGEGHDAVHLREQLHRLSDEKILQKAREERRVVLTCDLDFGDLLTAGLQQSPSVILFRLRDQRPAAVTPKLQEVVEQASRDLEAGAIVVVEDTRFRVRHLPIDKPEQEPS